jgi:hypothetical protein
MKTYMILLLLSTFIFAHFIFEKGIHIGVKIIISILYLCGLLRFYLLYWRHLK